MPRGTGRPGLAPRGIMIPHPGNTSPQPPPVYPELDSIDPATAAIGGAPFTLTCHGSNYTAQSVIMFDDAALATTFVSDQELTALVDPAAAVAGTVPVAVVTGADGTDPLDFIFTAT